MSNTARDEYAARLKKQDTADLWVEFREAISVTAAGFRRLAAIWCELKERGEDMSAYHNPLTSYLPDVNAGRLLPEAVIRYSASPALMACIRDLVPEEQEKLCSDKTRIPVLKPDGSVKDMRPLDLSVAQIKQVLGGGTIRTPEQQRRHLAAVRTSATEAPAPRATGDTKALFSALGLTPGQQADLEAAAERQKQTCAVVLLQLLIETGTVRDTAPVRAHRRVEHRVN